MFFNLFGTKKPLSPLEAGELIQLKFSGGQEALLANVNPMTGEPIGVSEVRVRILYATVSKVSKKRNLFVQFVSKDRGDDLEVGIEGEIAAKKPKKIIVFPTRLLHRDQETYIFSPPVALKTIKIPRSRKEAALPCALQIKYRAVSSPYFQQGTLVLFSSRELKFVSQLLIPTATTIALELSLPYARDPMRLKGKVAFCEPVSGAHRKYSVRLILEEMSDSDKNDLVHFLLLSATPTQW